MKNATPRDAGLIVDLLVELEFRSELIHEIISNLPELVPVNEEFYNLNKVFNKSLEIVQKGMVLLQEDTQKEFQEILNFSGNIFDFKKLKYSQGISSLRNSISNNLDRINKQIPGLNVKKLRKDKEKEHRVALEVVENCLAFLQTISAKKEIEYLGIELKLNGQSLLYKAQQLLLTESETELMNKLLENGATVGKQLKTVAKDEANLQKIKNNINKKFSTEFNFGYDLLPAGGYFINKIYKIIKIA